MTQKRVLEKLLYYHVYFFLRYNVKAILQKVLDHFRGCLYGAI